MTLDPGVRLGTYEILGPLGAGGMGEVYRAHDRKLGREVAIKVLTESFASDPSRVARFEREARMLAAVNHPGIAAIYGAEEDGDFKYIVMELVEGETLSEKLASGPIPIPEALSLASQIAEALSVAHEKNVIHRDLKPANIKVTPEGRVKVLDLGLAKAMAMEAPESDISKSPTIVVDDSRPGNLLGTPGFMSPEQARGKETDRRADIWAFGCVLFEMLSGKRAFPGDSVPDILIAILDREPDWKALPAATPGRIEDLLHRCLEKDPNRRLRDAGDARLEIDRSREEIGPRASLFDSLERRWPALLAIAAGIGAVAAIWFAVRSTPAASRAAPGDKQKQIVILPFRNLTGDDKATLIGIGMVETVGNRLSGLPGLQVVTPTATVAAASSDTEVLRIVRALGANLFVVGTLQRQGDTVRITYRVVNGDGVQLAANSLDGSASDLFALQDAVSDQVRRDLHYPAAAKRPTLTGGLDGGQQARYLQAIGLLQRYDKRESVEQALDLLRGLVEERPNSPIVQAALSRAYLGMFDFTKDRTWADKATAAIDTARALDPTLPEVEVTLGQTLLTTGRAAEAVEAFHRALATNPEDFQALLGLGRASERAGDDAQAESAFRKAIALQPTSWAGYNQLGALYSDRGRNREAIELFRQATRQSPDNERAWTNFGGAYTNACEFASALDGFKKALSLKPNSASAASNLGLTQLWTGRYAEAVASLESAARNSPKNFVIWGNLGDAYRGVSGRAGDAQKAYAQSIDLARDQLRLDPQDPVAHSFLATGLARTGHLAEAVPEMQKALAIDAKNPSILSDAAIVAALGGRDAEALDWLRKAVASGYCPAIIARQPEFEKLHSNETFQQLVRGPKPTES